ncbi:hypothetical protein pb186bvf_007981 [Paramecium bursaria]
MKNQSQTKSMHTVVQTNNIQYIVRNRQTLRRLLNPVVVEPKTQKQQSSTSISRKQVRTTHFKTQASIMLNPQIDMRKSLFNIVQSAEFKSKQESEHPTPRLCDFTIGKIEMVQTQTKQERIFSYYPRFKKIQEQENNNSQVFLKKILQVIKSIQARHVDIDYQNDNSFLSDRVKSQMTSPQMTLTGQLSIIPFQNQQTHLRTMGTMAYSLIAAIDKVQEPPTIVQQSKKKINITICQPDQNQIVHQFQAPDYILEDTPQDIQIEDPVYIEKPKYVLKQAIQHLRENNTSNKSQTKFSKSIMKIVGLSDDEQKKQTEEKQLYQIFTHSKTRRYFKLYFQNKIDKILSKVEEIPTIFDDCKHNRLSFALESPQTSRLLSGHTNQGSYTITYSQPSILIELPLYKIKQYSSYIEYIYEVDEQQYNDTYFIFDIEDTQTQGYIKIQECSQQIKTTDHRIQFICSELDDDTKNQMLSDQSRQIDYKKIEQQIQDINLSQCFNVVNHKISKLHEKDKQRMFLTIQTKYNEILTGVFEDIHEIGNQDPDYNFIEYEEPPPKYVKQETTQSLDKPTNKTRLARVQQAVRNNTNNQMVSTTHIELSPPSEQSNVKQSSRAIINNSPRTGIRHIPKKTSLLEASNSSTMQRRMTDSPSNSNQQTGQDETSLKIKEEVSNSTQSKKQKETFQQLAEKARQDPKKERNVFYFLIYKLKQNSMTKHSLLMRTHLQEDERRRSQTVSQQLSILIKESKFSELLEFLNNNPNIFINERCDDGNTYLIIAAQTGDCDIVEILLHKGSQVNLTNYQGESALHKAIAYNNFDCADLLIRNGAIQTIRNHQGQTPWQMMKSYF